MFIPNSLHLFTNSLCLEKEKSKEDQLVMVVDRFAMEKNEWTTNKSFITLWPYGEAVTFSVHFFIPEQKGSVKREKGLRTAPQWWMARLTLSKFNFLKINLI